MDEIELGILAACQEMVQRQQEVVPPLAAALGVSEEDVFYTWALRKCKQHGDLEGSDWCYFFHGLECDLRNTADGRFLRIDFGPGGRTDTFTAWGVLQFIMTSVAPWTEFARLKAFLADRPPPYDEYAGSLNRMGQVWDQLAAQGVFEQADPSLLAFQARYTTVGPDGINRIQYPAGTPEAMQIDCSVANRNLLSPRGLEILEARSPTMAATRR